MAKPKGKAQKQSRLGLGHKCPTSAASPGSRPITASDLDALVENINQKIDGMTTWLSMVKQRVSTAPQNMPQPLVRECP